MATRRSGAQRCMTRAFKLFVGKRGAELHIGIWVHCSFRVCTKSISHHTIYHIALPDTGVLNDGPDMCVQWNFKLPFFVSKHYCDSIMEVDECLHPTPNCPYSVDVPVLQWNCFSPVNCRSAVPVDIDMDHTHSGPQTGSPWKFIFAQHRRERKLNPFSKQYSRCYFKKPRTVPTNASPARKTRCNDENMSFP
ncbi:hypothetical protein CPC08DRAFT_688176 [Agrocybe pediades]|nr:hypothetical protein CPC08DRAFT_688176 [Agrocybe pediades]